MTANAIPIVVLGGGPAGLGLAYRLARRSGLAITVLERASEVGGNAGSFELEGLSVDYGSHRLHPACSAEVLADIRSQLGDDLLDRPRHGRIRLQGRWLRFPLRPVDLAMKLPWSFTLGVLRDALPRPSGNGAPENFVSVMERGLGRTICRDFYFPYTQKLWGLPPEELDAEQARRRVSAGTLGKMLRKVLNMVPGFRRPGAGRFYYPRHGYGQISKAYCQAARDAGVQVRLGVPVTRVVVEGGRVVGIACATKDNHEVLLPARHTFSTIPLPALVQATQPSAPRDVLESAAALKYRALVLVYLVLDTERFSEYDAHYFPEASIPISRLSEPKNYSGADRPGITILCAELPCGVADPSWRASDNELGDLVQDALASVDIPVRVPVRGVTTRRLAQAYPIYTANYRTNLDRLDTWLEGLEGLTTLGRQGLFAHDNIHHTLAMGYAAADCVGLDGEFNRTRWMECRRRFEHDVVED